MNKQEAKERLEYLRGELRAERISTGELIELEGLAEYIEPGDVELLEAAGVPEFDEEIDTAVCENCGKPAEYHSEVCLCSACEKISGQ